MNNEEVKEKGPRSCPLFVMYENKGVSYLCMFSAYWVSFLIYFLSIWHPCLYI